MKINLQGLRKIGMSLMTIMLINSGAHSANFTAVTSGDWSNTTTWGGSSPSYTNTLDVVTIPAGVTVTLDNNLTINGAGAVVDVTGTLQSSAAIQITITLGTLNGTGNISIGNLSIGTSGQLGFTGEFILNNMTNSALNLQSYARITVNQSLTLAAGLFSVQTNGVLAMGVNNPQIIVAGGKVAASGGGLDLSSAYDVLYTAPSNTVAGVELNGAGLRNTTVNFPSPATKLTLSVTLTVTGTLTLTSGTLALGLSNLIISGNIVTTGNSSISTTPASNITFNANGTTGSLNFTGTGNAVNNLTINVGTGNSAKIKGVLAVNGTLMLASGTLILDSVYLKLLASISPTGIGTIASTTSSDITVNCTVSPVGALRFNTPSAIRTFNIAIANGGTLKIGSNLFIRDTLSLTKGSIEIGIYHLQIGAAGTITGGDSNSYVITDGVGFLSRYITAGNPTAMIFPVGTATDYFPAHVRLNTGSSSGTISMGVLQHVYSNGNGAGIDLSITQPVVDATWLFESDIISNLDMDLTLMWSGRNEKNGFRRNVAYISHYVNNTWDSGTTAAATMSNGMYTLSRNNITVLSPYAIFDNTAMTTGVHETAGSTQPEIYPNPTADMLYIHTVQGAADAINADIMNMNGQIIASYVLTGNQNSISLRGLKEGYYYIQLHNSQINTVKKIVRL